MLSPWRKRRMKVDGVLKQEQRRELPNDAFLGMVRDYLHQGHTATIWVKGYSMRPFLEHMRDKVQLKPVDELRDYDAVLAEIRPGHYVLHRIIAIDGDNITLMGDGNLRGTEHCLRSHVCGIVTHYIRPKRTIKANDAALQRRIVKWRKRLRWRRYLLAIYKATI
ncbi:MAG: S24/S26 family peptidase [Bacteroidales bacterium]|nr:S24/S26 family peptidase [Candidatus Physcousia equi]